ncbi:hypothetical protein BHM03_00047206 [Ensete ventricosum]|nr:hypothetical protein BHM03_00047206 [Ensete ventricosum]
MTKPLLPIASGSSVVVGDPVSWLPTVGDGVLGRGLGAPGAQEHTDRGLEPCVEPRGRWCSRDARLLPPEIRWLGSGRRGLPVPGIARFVFPSTIHLPCLLTWVTVYLMFIISVLFMILKFERKRLEIVRARIDDLFTIYSKYRSVRSIS